MIKYLCDRCQHETTSDHRLLSSSKEEEFMSVTLCESCFEDFKDWLKYKDWLAGREFINMVVNTLLERAQQDIDSFADDPINWVNHPGLKAGVSAAEF